MKKIIKKKNKVSLFDSENWVKIVTNTRLHYNNPLQEDEMSIRTFSYSKKVTEIRRIELKLGILMLNKLNFNIGDKIVPFNSEKNQNLFMLVKTENGEGFTVQKLYKSSHGKIVLKIDRVLGINPLYKRTKEYQINKGKIIFELPTEKGST